MTEQEFNQLLDRLKVEDMIQVASDILNKIKPADSKLNYTDDLLAYRKIAEVEIAATPQGQFVEYPKV